MSFNSIFFVRLGAIEAKSTYQELQPISTPVVRTDIKGRLLAPNEGCGYSKVESSRIVGGVPAKNGSYNYDYVNVIIDQTLMRSYSSKSNFRCLALVSAAGEKSWLDDQL